VKIDDFDEGTRKRFLIGMAWTCMTETQLANDLALIANLPFDEQYHYVRAVLRQQHKLLFSAACQAWVKKNHAKINNQIKWKEVRVSRETFTP